MFFPVYAINKFIKTKYRIKNDVHDILNTNINCN